MPIVVVGWMPIQIEPIFSRGQDWVVTFEPAPGSTSPVWPDGTTVVAHIYPADTDTGQPLASWTEEFAWPGVITGDNIAFKGPATEADQVDGAALMRVRVSYPNTPTPDVYTWLEGSVTRVD